jgi:hypothetical protein
VSLDALLRCTAAEVFPAQAVSRKRARRAGTTVKVGWALSPDLSPKPGGEERDWRGNPFLGR